MQVNIPLIFLFHAEPCALTSHLSRHDIEKVAHPGAAGAILHPITDDNLLLSLLQGPSRKGRRCDICAHPNIFLCKVSVSSEQKWGLFLLNMHLDSNLADGCLVGFVYDASLTTGGADCKLNKRSQTVFKNPDWDANSNVHIRMSHVLLGEKAMWAIFGITEPNMLFTRPERDNFLMLSYLCM